MPVTVCCSCVIQSTVPGHIWWNTISGVPVISIPPIIITGVVGLPIIYTQGIYIGNGITITRQWYRNGVAISGQVGTSYTPMLGDVGASITVVETATNMAGSITSGSNALIISLT